MIAKDPLDLLPEQFVNKEDVEAFDKVFDRVATESRWSNKDVARAFVKMICYITNDNARNGGRKRR